VNALQTGWLTILMIAKVLILSETASIFEQLDTDMVSAFSATMEHTPRSFMPTWVNELG
jgi:50S ribosomal subunit-associated GTPase HflX